jgi:hypothetical protein
MAKRRATKRKSNNTALLDFNSVSFYLALLFVLLVSMFLVSRMIGVNILGVNSSPKEACTTIQEGTLKDSYGETLTTGFSSWGYNYEANIFNGKYCDAYHNAAWCQAYKDDNLSMKWNDAWLSNKDCNGDGLLDRHYGFDSYRGSGAWLTNHMSGKYVGVNGKNNPWTYFVKIVAAPVDATLTGGVWFMANGTKLGPTIWGEFAIVQEISNDPVANLHGKAFLSEYGPGFGHIK